MAVSAFAGPTTGPLGSSSGGTSGSVAFTIPSGHSNVLLLVEVKREAVVGPMLTLKWNTSESLTKLDSEAANTTWGATEIWSLANPTPGSFNVDWTKTSDALLNHGALGIYALDGVDLASSFGTVQKGHSNSAAADSLTVPTVGAGDFTVDVLTIDGTGHSAVATGTGHTLDWGPIDSGAGTNEGYGGKSTQSGSVAMNWTWTTAGPESHMAVNVKAAAATAAPMRALWEPGGFFVTPPLPNRLGIPLSHLPPVVTIYYRGTNPDIGAVES